MDEYGKTIDEYSKKLRQLISVLDESMRLQEEQTRRQLTAAIKRQEAEASRRLDDWIAQIKRQNEALKKRLGGG